MLIIVIITTTVFSCSWADHVTSQGQGNCTLPKQWAGRWRQSGRGEVVIRSSTISDRGRCYDRQGDFYVFHNRDDNCYYCFFFLERHRNIVQYKESRCLREAPMPRSCGQLQVDSVLHTLVREHHRAGELCPLAEAYYFTYYDVTYTSCDTPLSYVTPCVDRRQLRFHFRHCYNGASLHGSDATLHCIGSWRDGSANFLYGTFRGLDLALHGNSKDEDTYRCFRYQVNDGAVTMAMSVDESCQALHSDTDGPLTMTLTRDAFGWPRAGCQFGGVASREWTDLSERHVITVSPDNTSIIESHRKKVTKTDSHVTDRRVCLDSDVIEKVKDKRWYYLTFTTHTCTSRRQCLTLNTISPNIMELALSALDDYSSVKQCKSATYTTRYLLTSGQPIRSQAPVSCGQRGVYNLVLPSTQCTVRLSMACYNTSDVTVENSCTGIVYSAQCYVHWKRNHVTYFLLKTAATAFHVLRWNSTNAKFSMDTAITGKTSPPPPPDLVNTLLTSHVTSVSAECTEKSTPITRSRSRPSHNKNNNTASKTKYKHKPSSNKTENDVNRHSDLDLESSYQHKAKATHDTSSNEIIKQQQQRGLKIGHGQLKNRYQSRDNATVQSNSLSRFRYVTSSYHSNRQPVVVESVVLDVVYSKSSIATSSTLLLAHISSILLFYCSVQFF